MAQPKESSKRNFLVGHAEVAAPWLEPALYLVATPIGNLSDITLRALETLAGADILACEDTRITQILLKRYGIRTNMTAYHEHNEAVAGSRLIAAIEEGKSVALASDAGTPMISDPGFQLVRAAHEKNLRVIPVPGPSAVLAGLTASGLPSNSFFFAGFLPSRAGERSSRLTRLAMVPGTLIFFESPRRLADSLDAMVEILGEREASVARELTKTFEEIRRGTLATLANHYREGGAPRGEAVICVAPPQEAMVPMDTGQTDRLLLALAEEMPSAKAARKAAGITGARKSDLYKRLLVLREGKDGL